MLAQGAGVMHPLGLKRHQAFLAMGGDADRSADELGRAAAQAAEYRKAKEAAAGAESARGSKARL